MSNHNPEHTPNRKRTREERKKLMVRIVALLMAILMVAGAAYYTIYMLSVAASAADVHETEIVDTSSLTNSGDVPVRVGLTYGDSVTVGFEVTSEAGFVVGITETDGSCRFTPLWDLPYTRVSAVADGNLSKNHMTYSLTYESSRTVIGGFHVQVDCDRYNRIQFTELLREAEDAMAGYGMDVTPAYVYTGYTMRIGNFATREKAQKWVETVEEIFPEETVYVTGASETSVAIVHPESDKILFEYDCGGETELGLQADEDKNGNTYMKTPAANVYDGIFVFSRSKNASADGVALTNIISLETYIAGVLPYEISNTWPVEALKAFAVTVRSFTLTHGGRHEADGFDLCANVHCQVYKGAGRVNRNVWEAVTGTAGQVMTYDGKIVNAYYSSSVGGTTVSAKDAWGGDIPYLQAKETPWENYMEHANAFWIVEMTPAELGDQLRKAGYELSGSIADVRIGALAPGSTYIKILQVTDSAGKVMQITGTDAIRAALAPTIKSANFVVGKGSVEYTEPTGTGVPEKDQSAEKEPVAAPVSPSEQYDKDYGYINLYGYHVQTAEREYVADIDFSVTLITGSGEQIYDRQDIFVLSSESASAFTGENFAAAKTETEPVKESRVTETVERSTETVVYKVAHAENPNNFIFVGKGWGHGVGISQYGAYDLAGLGYSAEEILEAYFDGIVLVHYRSTDQYAGQ
ncbi:MAG: SpoIID/LytB domain-containing protein [Clostridia bacterium]|nr:SpoIID/LytB domain-containing protein [Clostridia bacterium]